MEHMIKRLRPLHKNLRGFVQFVIWMLIFPPSLACAQSASGLYIPCQTVNDKAYVPPTTINVARNAEVGDLIGSWITTATTAWRCYRSKSYLPADTVYLGVAGTAYYSYLAETAAITVDGQSHTVYKASNRTGLGYITRWRTTYRGQTSDWQSAEGYGVIIGTARPDTLFGPVAQDNEEIFMLSVEAQVHFVKTANTLVAGDAVDTFTLLTLGPYRTTNPAVGSTLHHDPWISVVLNSGIVAILLGGTCTTPDVSVKFPTVPLSAFSGIGSVAGVTPFNLRFNDCPAGMNSIRYRFDAVSTTVLDAVNGVIELDTEASTATGVGIQLLTENGTPLVFSSGTHFPYTLDSYNPASRGSYSVPLQAGIYQTSGSVSAGSIKGSVTFTMDYQ